VIQAGFQHVADRLFIPALSGGSNKILFKINFDGYKLFLINQAQAFCEHNEGSVVPCNRKKAIIGKKTTPVDKRRV
jgi:hypothetical protein